MLMKHRGEKKSASLDSLSVSREQRVSHCSAAEKEKKRKKRKEEKKKKKAKSGKKVQSESFCNCSHLILPSATAALSLLARWFRVFLLMCRGKLTVCSCSSTLTDFSLMVLVSTVASRHSYQRPTATVTIAAASNKVIFFLPLFHGCHPNPSWYYSRKSAACPLLGGDHKNFRRPVEILLLFQPESE